MNTPRIKPALSTRMKDIAPFRVMDILAQARAMEAQGKSIIHMEIGEPDFATPQPIVDAGLDALRSGQLPYTAAAGLPALREAIASHYDVKYGVHVDPGRIFITPGSSGALLLVLGALVSEGAGVLLPDPGYPCNRNFVRFVGGIPVDIPVDAENSFQPTARQIVDYWQNETCAVMLASPANPTGAVLSDDRLVEIHRVVSDRGGALIVDEIYHGLTYGGCPRTAVGLDGATFVVNSFSKYYGMTGWRLGWVVAPEEYCEALERLAQNLFIAASTPAQIAALVAFHPETDQILLERREAFRARRDFLLPALKGLGFEISAPPDGAFYLYANCSRVAPSSADLAAALLAGAGVAVTPGADFGAVAPEQHIRFAYTTSLDNLTEGVDRIAKYLKHSGAHP